NNIRQQISDIQTQAAQKQEFLQTVDAKKSFLADQQIHEKELNVVLPTDDQMEDALRIIDRAAATAQVSVESVSDTSTSVQNSLRSRRVRAEDTDIPADVLPFGFNVKTAGTYQQIRTLLDELYKSARIFDVATLTLSRDKNQLDSLSTELAIRFYSYQPGQ
ncbi:MAG: type 4a pilus biogenesis protein PilO, partial [Candidatus Binatia bacterium]|nr:type 4a pilus biogenesis protein PilO [Candidatus Binatia bacterium]